MKKITLKQLMAAGACGDSLRLFKKTFGDSVVVTKEVCEEHCLVFSGYFDSAAYRLLPRKDFVEFQRLASASISKWSNEPLPEGPNSWEEGRRNLSKNIAQHFHQIYTARNPWTSPSIWMIWFLSLFQNVEDIERRSS